MKIQCDCKKFQAEVANFPKHTPGHTVCYCIDCQTYLHKLGRPEILDYAGGTDIIPVYPQDLHIESGKEHLGCLRLSPKGLHRWYVSCCNTPIGNLMPKFPWVGLVGHVFTADPKKLDEIVGPVKSRIHGQYATQTPPVGTSAKTTWSDLFVILPFLLKGFLTGKAKPSPFFAEDQVTPIKQPQIVSLDERNRIRASLLHKV